MNKIDGILDKYLTEGAMKDFDYSCKQIAKLTDRNDHNAARKMAAELMKLVTKDSAYEGWIGEYDTISKEHKRKGSMTSDLMGRRDKSDEKFFKQAKKDLPPDLFDALWSAF